jgi:tRNA-2-methylthio-N6-dimethylallyladenosine synthase
MKKFYIQTYGCQMNAYDSGSMAAHLERCGFSPADEPGKADLVIVNTCSVRQMAEHKAASLLGRLSDLKEKRPELHVVLAGCMAERTRQSIRKRFPVVDLVVGATEVERFPELLAEIIADLKPGTPSAADTAHPTLVTSFVTIMRGCENFCSYCIVPFVRGKEQSRPAQEILTEIAARAQAGTREVTLLGQNVNSYHDGSIDFPELLQRVNGVPGLERIRFMTNHPKDASDRLIDAMRTARKVCEHIHLPLQSASDRVLSAMNRRYTYDEYKARVDRVRRGVPGISLSTDILIGFPGESDDDFRRTLDAVHTLEFDFLFAFKYSPRPGTAAMRMNDDVPLAVKEERLARILETEDGVSARKNAALRGTVQEVLVEGRHEDICEGRTRGNKKVFFRSPDDLTGRLVHVTISDTKINSLTGTVTVHHP